ncbi:MAG: TrkH family potassium uptake protein [Clostridia bacterium]|nr:TrkH family potassium uptake protein [Clostridia bacterium]
MNYRIIRYTLGCTLYIEAFCFLIPLLCAVFNSEFQYIPHILFSIALCVLCGFLLAFKKPADKTMYAKEGFISVAMSWIIISIFGAIPFMTTGFIPNFFDALFETVSGFTTTGASILTDVEALPKCLLLWRSFSHWIGGMGVLVFLVAILPLSGGDNMHLIKAESPGPAVSKLVPKVRSTAKILYLIYIGITVTQIILLKLGGLDWFESLALSFGTAGTGGFGTRNSGIAEYSPYVQNIITIFMILFGIDFSFYYLILMRKLKSALKMEEVRGYLLIILTAIVVIMINCYGMYSNIWDNLRYTAFQVGSIITTTGYSTVDFNLWPELSKTIILILMFIGACAGSTGGGIKVSRIMIFLKGIFKEIKLAIHPRRTVKVTMNGRMIEHETVRGVNVYMAAYIVIFFVALLIISIDNFDFTTNFSAVAATLNNIGPGLNLVGPVSNFSCYSDLSTFVLTVAMLIGRLEIFPILILFSRHTWRK